MSDIPRFLYAQMAVAERNGDKVVLRPQSRGGGPAGVESVVVGATAWESLGGGSSASVTVTGAGEPRLGTGGDTTVTSLRNALLTLITAVRPLPDLPETTKAALDVADDVLHGSGNR